MGPIVETQYIESTFRFAMLQQIAQRGSILMIYGKNCVCLRLGNRLLCIWKYNWEAGSMRNSRANSVSIQYLLV